jgi:malonyl-CoA/methylmalonyl-CoA synthetase
VEVRIVDERDDECPDGTPGEVQLKSPHLFAGYWNNAAATSDAFADGWFRTGDIAVRSGDGYITLRGRRGDLIISAGFNIYPREIEEVLLEHRAVREVAVVGAADPVRGEVPIAYVVTDRESDTMAVELEALCSDQLARFKVPRKFIRIAELPRNAMGKVQRHLLPSE